MVENKEFSLWVGVDWASDKHQVCVVDASGAVLEERSVEHSGEELGAWVDALVARGDGPIAVAIETPHSAVVDTLLDRGIAVFSINPKQLDRFRDRYTVAGAKDDRRDALVLAMSLRTDAQAYRRIELAAAELVELRELVRTHDELVAEVNVLGNRVIEQLRRFYPQILALGSMHSDRWLWALLDIAPTPARARHVPRAKIEKLLRLYRIRRRHVDEVLGVLRAEPLRVAPGVTEACAHHVALLLSRLRLAHEQRWSCFAAIEKRLGHLSEPDAEVPEESREHRSAVILRSWPGLGTLVCATMLAEAWQPLEAGDYRILRAQCGVAPVTKQSGKRAIVLMRRACNMRLRTALHQWAMAALRLEPRAREHYLRLRAKGLRHARALRGVADRLLNALTVTLAKRTLYDGALRFASTTPS